MAPEKSFGYGTNVPPENGIPIGTFRGAGCGNLESFAKAEKKSS
jgi:hypothetical protein